MEMGNKWPGCFFYFLCFFIKLSIFLLKKSLPLPEKLQWKAKKQAALFSKRCNAFFRRLYVTQFFSLRLSFSVAVHSLLCLAGSVGKCTELVSFAFQLFHLSEQETYVCPCTVGHYRIDLFLRLALGIVARRRGGEKEAR